MNRFYYWLPFLFQPFLLNGQLTFTEFCQQERVIYIQPANDKVASIKAESLLTKNISQDSVLYRIYDSSLVPDFNFNERLSAAEILVELPDSLNFDCRFLVRPRILGIVAVNPDSSWEVCITKLILADTTDACLEDGQLTKICVNQPNGTPVTNVTIAWGNGIPNTAANLQGGCVFAKPDSTQSINLFKVDELALGVSAFDLLLIRRHILGLTPFTKATQFLAADVNNTGTITTKDLLDLQKVIIGKVDFFPGNSGWRIIPTFWLDNDFDWQNLAINYFLYFDPKTFKERPYEFTAIKVGDVSGIPVD